MDQKRLIEKLEKIAVGKARLTEKECLLSFSSLPIAVLFKYADMVRERLNGNLCTFTIDRNINYTNVCEIRCAFCAFSRDEGDGDAFVLPVKEILERVKEAEKLGATQIMLQGGLYRKTGLSYITEVFRAIRDACPDMTIHSLSAPEIEYLSKIENKSLEEILNILRDSGLCSLPGGGAEILSDEVRTVVSPKKTKTSTWLKVHETAHHLGMASTATMVIGHREDLKHRVDHLSLIRNLQDRTGGFRSFITWIYHPGNTELGGEATTSADYLKTIAIERLFLDNIPHIQASWISIGRQVGQVALHAGADDLGSLMLEEKVVRATGHDFMAMERDEMINLIRSAGREPAHRRTDFSIIKRFN
ncbi:MAG: dehypoxanthine futalosine cyclase [Syntrophus sp. (in: bacteria)]|nr:dehypoxanthine futalosine cyclase [Syntrophus sp. (in: bacteria)]